MKKDSNIVQLMNGEPHVSHRIIAKHTGNKEVSLRNLINKHIDKFELFGVPHFENESVSEEKLKDNPDTKPKKTYFLNEPQATLLLTFMRNNEIVINFKVRLVDEFFLIQKHQLS